MQTYEQTFAGAVTWKMAITGSYFTLLACALAVNVRFYRGGKKLDLGTCNAFLPGLEVGPLERGPGGTAAFDFVEIDVGGADTVKIGIGDGSARYNRSQGSVAITNINGAFADTQKSVTNANQVLLAANANRRYAFIQNNSGAGQVLRVSLDGTAATATKGKRLASGQYFELQGFVATTAINGFMETADATANNVDLTEG